MSFRISVSGAAADAVRRTVPVLVADLVASGITAQDAELWGPEAEDEASKRLGWTEAVAVSRPLVPEIEALRDELEADGVTHIVLGGMGGSSLAPEVITRTARVDLTVLDSTEPGQVRAALADRLAESAIVVSSKSGSTVETDSQRRAYEQAFRDAGIDPTTRIIVVTDPGSPLDESARAAGYRVFNADPTVGGRYSALTAFGLVPSGSRAPTSPRSSTRPRRSSSRSRSTAPRTPGLVLGAAIAATRRCATSSRSSPTARTSSASPTGPSSSSPSPPGKEGTGILPVVLDTDAPELTDDLADVQVVRLVDDAGDQIFGDHDTGEIRVSGTPRRAVARVGVRDRRRRTHCSASTRSTSPTSSRRRSPRAACSTPAPSRHRRRSSTDGIEVRGTPDVIGASSDLVSAIDVLLEELPGRRVHLGAGLRRPRRAPRARAPPRPARRACGRPVTFGWGPALPALDRPVPQGRSRGRRVPADHRAPAEDLAIPERPFTFGELIAAQASGDASVLADHGRPVLTLTLTDPAANLATLLDAVG